MLAPPTTSYKIALSIAVALLLSALALSFLASGFSLGNDVVYGAF
jgi:hypothetical protein